MLLIYWIPTVILISTNVEIVVISAFPWTSFFLSSFAMLTFSFILCIGIVVTYPVYISMGPLLAIPINAVIDVLYRDSTFDTIKILGTISVIAGFIILTIPLPVILSFSAKLRSRILCDQQ